MSSLGGFEATISDAVTNKKFPANTSFIGYHTAGVRYDVHGYIYPDYKYGSILLHAWNKKMYLVTINAENATVTEQPTRAEMPKTLRLGAGTTNNIGEILTSIPIQNNWIISAWTFGNVLALPIYNNNNYWSILLCDAELNPLPNTEYADVAICYITT